jgi:hypothetical protein
MNIITLIGMTCILFYSVSQICNFYGIGYSTYGPYMLFYIFIIISSVILPHSYKNP